MDKLLVDDDDEVIILRLPHSALRLSKNHVDARSVMRDWPQCPFRTKVQQCSVHVGALALSHTKAAMLSYSCLGYYGQESNVGIDQAKHFALYN
jgi:hypothetical protein